MDFFPGYSEFRLIARIEWVQNLKVRGSRHSILAKRQNPQILDSACSQDRMGAAPHGPPFWQDRMGAAPQFWIPPRLAPVAKIEWEPPHSILAFSVFFITHRSFSVLRGGPHSILSKRRPLRGGSHSILAKRRNPEYPEKWNFLSLNSMPAYNSVVHLVIFWCVW